MNKKENYHDFLYEIAEKIEQKYNQTVKAEVITVKKNNNVPVDSLLLKQKGGQLSPNFYLEHSFEEWKSKAVTVEHIAEQVYNLYEEEIKTKAHLAENLQLSWEVIRNDVFMQLINRDKNQKLLQKVPYQEFLDLAIIYYYSVRVSEHTVGTITITKELLDFLEISKEELHQAALANEKQVQPVQIRTMQEVLQLLGRKWDREISDCFFEDSVPMYVLSNMTGCYGATAMIFQEELQQFAERLQQNLFLLPSSIHEVILVPEREELCLEYFCSMVKEINETQVDATEVLSDSIYFYDRFLKKLHRIG